MSVLDFCDIVDRMIKDFLDVQARYVIGRHQAGCRATQVMVCES
jgi:hypothetical protein